MGDTPIHDSRDMHIINPTDSTKKVTTTTDGAKELLDVNSRNAPRPGTFVNKLAVDSGASPDLTVDGSVTPVEFNVVASTGKIFYVRELAIILQDNSMNYTKFGGRTALTNGLSVEVKEGGEAVRDIPIGSIKTNAGFALAGAGVQLTSANTDLLVVLFNIWSKTGTSFKLVDSDSDFFRVTVNDDLTSLDNFTVVVEGYEVDE